MVFWKLKSLFTVTTTALNLAVPANDSGREPLDSISCASVRSEVDIVVPMVAFCKRNMLVLAYKLLHKETYCGSSLVKSVCMCRVHCSNENAIIFNI